MNLSYRSKIIILPLIILIIAIFVKNLYKPISAILDNFARKYTIKMEDRFVIHAKDLKFENGITIYNFICLCVYSNQFNTELILYQTIILVNISN